MLTLVFAVILFVHLVSVQLAAAGPLVAMFLLRSSPPDTGQAAKRLVVQSLVALLAAVVTGLFLGWFATAMGHRDYTSVMTRYYPRLWWGIWEIVFSLLVTSVLWLVLQSRLQRRAGRGTAWLLAVATSLNLLYHFPPLLTIVAQEVQTPPLEPLPLRPIASAEYRSLLASPAVIAKSLHFVLAAFATTGAWLLVWGTRRAAGPFGDPWIAKRAGMIALVAMLLQMLSGFWLVMQVDFQTRSRLLGGDALATGSLLVGIVSGFYALSALGTLAVGEVTLRVRRHAAALILAALFAMVLSTSRLSGIAGW